MSLKCLFSNPSLPSGGDVQTVLPAGSSAHFPGLLETGCRHSYFDVLMMELLHTSQTDDFQGLLSQLWWS
jgi:hypothetical protein